MTNTPTPADLIAALPRPDGFNRWDPATWPAYDPDLHLAAVMALADEMGEEGIARYEGSGFDWERFIDKMEAYLYVNLPDQTDDPLFDKIKRIARKAWRENG